MSSCDWIDKELDILDKKHAKQASTRKHQNKLKDIVSRGGGQIAQNGDASQLAVKFLSAFFVLGMGGFLAILSAILHFISLLVGIFFKALIIWKHLRLLQSFKVQIPYPVVIALSISQILSDLRAMAFPFVEFIDAVLTQFGQFFQFLSTITFDLNVVVSITCKGSTAPLKLLLDMVVLGVIILVIESKVQLFREIALKNVSHKFFATITTREFFVTKDYVSYVLLLIQCGLAEFCSSFINLSSLLQYSMSFVNLQSFIADNGKHESTPTCDQVVAAPKMDSFLAWSSTFAALISIMPALYEVSKILCPMHPTDSWCREIQKVMIDEYQSTKISHESCSFLIKPIKW